MEYVEGFSLEQHCRIDKLLPMHRVIGIIFKCCMALDAAYRQGIMHRDIKPANILVAADDEAKIADFGLALNMNKDLDRDSTFIMGVGSPAYMSPEQIKNYPLNQKTDLYSLGVVLFQLLTGRLPFRAANQATLVYRIVNTDAPAVTALNPNLPEGLNAILKRAWRRISTTVTATAPSWPRISRRCATRYSRTTRPSRTPAISRPCASWLSSPSSRTSKYGRCCVFRSGGNWRRMWRHSRGRAQQIFGIIINGCVEISIDGRSLCRLGPGEPVGEVAFLHPASDQRSATAISLEPTLFLEINAAALALSSEELLERMRNTLLSRMIKRLREVNKIAAAQGATGNAGGTGSLTGMARSRPGGGLDLELTPM
jgi:eukaryotic-like serine/threonine-protein kinase